MVLVGRLTECLNQQKMTIALDSAEEARTLKGLCLCNWRVRGVPRSRNLHE
jgi:hypothetical protein